jgi:hypothetical protein
MDPGLSRITGILRYKKHPGEAFTKDYADILLSISAHLDIQMNSVI